MKTQYLVTKSERKKSTSTEINWEKITREISKKVGEKKGSYQEKYQEKIKPGTPEIPRSIQLRDYQEKAVISWFKNNGRGTLKMATGSGKTITALAIATKLYQTIGLKVLLVICPYCHLVKQWGRECEKFNLQPILAFENVNNWHKFLSNQLYNILAGTQPFLTIITTNSTLITESFQCLLKYLPQKSLIIGDEAHNLGAPKLEESLPRFISLRLALSATPERHYDEVGTDSLFNYFGEILKPEFSLGDAIKKGALVKYEYYPILVELTEGEAKTYAKLTKRIGWALNGYNPYNSEPEMAPEMASEDMLTSLLVQRSRLIGAAANKLVALRELMVNRLHTNHTLFYCGDGYVSNDGAINRQVEAVTRILGHDLGYRVNTYTAKTPLKEREEMRKQFVTGKLQGLVAIRCLDEGVDIPAIENAVILASSTNPRQFIQRRGRILRPHPGKEKATLFDMLVMPPNLERDTWEVERALLRKELNRLMEFANLADNANNACKKLLALQKQYGF